MFVFIAIGLITAVITIGLGYWSYVIGKHNQTNLIGSIIPAGYFIVRVIFAVVLCEGSQELITSLAGNLAITIIFVGLFAWGKQRAGKGRKKA